MEISIIAAIAKNNVIGMNNCPPTLIYYRGEHTYDDKNKVRGSTPHIDIVIERG